MKYKFTEAEGGHPFLLCNFIFYFEVFQKYSNSTLQFYQFNFIFYPSMKYITTKILYAHPNWEYVASLHSKRRFAVLIEVKRKHRELSLRMKRSDMFQVRVGDRTLVVKCSIEG